MAPDALAMAPNLVSAAPMLAIATAAFVLARVRLGPVWGAMAIGGGLWVAAIALKLVWALAFNTPIFEALTGNLPPGVGAWAFYVYVGALTGVFECLALYPVARYVGPVRRLDRNGALALGVGFGATEAALLGLAALANWLAVIVAPASLPPEALAVMGPIDWILAPAAGVERVTAIAVHAFCCFAILHAARTGALAWLWAAVALKTGLDTAAAWAGLGFGLTSAAHVWTAEAILAVFGVLAVWGLVVLVPRWPAEEAGQPAGWA